MAVTLPRMKILFLTAFILLAAGVFFAGKDHANATASLPPMGEEIDPDNPKEFPVFAGGLGGEAGVEETDDEFATFIREKDRMNVYLDLTFPEDYVAQGERIAISIPSFCEDGPCGGSEYIVTLGDAPDAVFVFLEEERRYRLRGKFSIHADSAYSQGVISHMLTALKK